MVAHGITTMSLSRTAKTRPVADRDAHLGYAYVMNKLDFHLENDPREKALRDAVYRPIARLTARTRAVEMDGASNTEGAL